MGYVTRTNKSRRQINASSRTALFQQDPESYHRYGWVMSRIQLSRVADVNASSRTALFQQHPESCRKYGWVMSHVRIRRVAREDESCLTCECVMSHMLCQQRTESCRTYGLVMSHVGLNDTWPHCNQFYHTHAHVCITRTIWV